MKPMDEAGFYVLAGTAYIPIKAKTEAGFYIDVEPVEVANIRDGDAFATALARTLGQNNPEIPTPARDAFPGPVVLKYAKLHSWSRFFKEADYWSVSKTERDWTFGRCKRGASNGWEPDHAVEKRLEADADFEQVVRYIVTSVQSLVGDKSPSH